VRASAVRTNGLEFGLLEAGSGPLALCLHGFPDTAYTWQKLLPALARRAVPLLAPSSRMIVIGEAGHFLHLEKPGEVNNHILAWVTG
jgi:pimeloyl-ACP methyl ester carboxylesterase